MIHERLHCRILPADGIKAMGLTQWVGGWVGGWATELNSTPHCGQASTAALCGRAALLATRRFVINEALAGTGSALQAKVGGTTGLVHPHICSLLGHLSLAAVATH